MADVEIKPQRYRDERPQDYFAEYHERVRAGEPDASVYEAVRLTTLLHALVTYRARSIGAEHVPKDGPLILAPNHASFMDHFFTAAFLRRRVQFMAKSQLFTHGGVLTYIFSHGGVFPVRRGSQDEEAFISAFRILARGGAIGMYCEGTRSRTGRLATEARPGIGRMVLESGAAIVPVAILGSYQVRNWKRLRFPRVTVAYGEPLHYPVEHEPSRERQQEVADEILVRIRDLHARLAAGQAPGTQRRFIAR